ncbi:hypothetical protein KIW84_066086 [Lathyrus oleraceus]|uniref:Uncharacterized protein n=1 Tax=Pisum sativum TaxID=3888 RepID=A0A9D5AB45_PEA|nr:hypothetical protein KIW84_066086 [Pisum sativum]
MVSFKDRAPDMKANPLPAHGNASINMVDGCPGGCKVFDFRFIRRSLVMMHKDICLVSDCEHDHDGCAICNVNSRGCEIVERDIQRLMDEGDLRWSSVRPVFPKDMEDSTVSNKVKVFPANPISASKHQSGESNNLKTNDDDEVLRLIKKSEFNMVEQLLQTPTPTTLPGNLSEEIKDLSGSTTKYRSCPKRSKLLRKKDCYSAEGKRGDSQQAIHLVG